MDFRMNSRGARLALIAAVLTVVTTGLPQWSWLRTYAPQYWLPYYGVMAAYLGLMILTMTLCEKRLTAGRAQVYVLVQAILLAVAEYLAHGQGVTWLWSMPLVGQAGSLLSPWRARLWTVALFVQAVTFKVYGYGWESLGPWAGSAVGAYLFAYAFTHLAVEADARRREALRLAEALGQANEQLQQQASQLATLTREQERARVARELHDSLGHTLTSLAVQLEVVLALADRHAPKATVALERARVLAQSALVDVRESVSALRSGGALRPLVERVEDLVQLDRSAGREVDLRVEGTPAALPADGEQVLFRSVQEGLTNVRRHSDSPRVRIQLSYTSEKRVGLRLEDDGPARPGSRSGGFGLQGLRERVAALGGTCEAGPRPEGGFGLRVEVPR